MHWTRVRHEQRFKDDDDTIQTATNLKHVALGGGGVVSRLSGSVSSRSRL